MGRIDVTLTAETANARLASLWRATGSVRIGGSSGTCPRARCRIRDRIKWGGMGMNNTDKSIFLMSQFAFLVSRELFHAYIKSDVISHSEKIAMQQRISKQIELIQLEDSDGSTIDMIEIKRYYYGMLFNK